MRPVTILVGLALLGCGGEATPTTDAGTPPRRDAAVAPPDAGGRDAHVALPDGAAPRDAAVDDGGDLDAGTDDAGEAGSDLTALRDALFATHTSTPCATWASFDTSQRAVFLTLTHRLFTSRLPDGSRMLEHVRALHLVRGGGADGTRCGGAENNRLFLSMDDYLWAQMVATWEGATPIDDGAGGTWIHTADRAGPHDPFDASDETSTGLRCALVFEQPESRPPTAQAHFFLDGSATRVERGSAISLDADPRMLEIDHDFNCIHDSNPTCGDFEDRYRTHHGDFECEWVPTTCTPEGTGCYRSAR